MNTEARTDVSRGAMIFFAATVPDVRQQEHLTRLVATTHGSRFNMNTDGVEGLKLLAKKGLRDQWRSVTPVEHLIAPDEEGTLDVTNLGKIVMAEILE